MKELTRVVTPETEEEWLEAARGKTCAEVQAMVAGRKKGDGPEDPDQPDLRMRRMMVEMTPQMVAMYRELRAAIEVELGHSVEELEIWRIVLERARSCPEGPSTPAQISVCSHCNRGWQDGGGIRAELDAAEIATARCDGEELGAVEGDPGRKRLTISKKTRRRILARHHHRCAVPGCRNARYLDVHHIEHQEDGGGHEDSNLLAWCSTHHLLHHRGALRIEGGRPMGSGTSLSVPTWARTGVRCSAEPLHAQRRAMRSSDSGGRRRSRVWRWRRRWPRSVQRPGSMS